MSRSPMLLRAGAIAAALLASQPGVALSARLAYPSKPIRVVVPFTAGSATDIMARIIGPKMAETWGQQVVVDNRPSAGGIIGGSIVANAAPDGHTIMVASAVFAGSAALFKKLPYDPLKDFRGITQLASTPFVLVVSPALGVKSVKELIELARQKPGQLNFGSSGLGGGTHYAGERFRLAAKIDAVHVPYKGTPEAQNDTIAGRLQFMMTPVLSSVPLIRTGKLLALAVSTPQRAVSLSDVPTLAEVGLPDGESDGWYGAFAPAKTPDAIVNTLAREIDRILGLPEIRDKITAQGVVIKATPPDVFDRMVRDEILLRRKIFGASGAKVE
ncbi:MAG TPA: tripartite tricarboxylate transporter substrate binding protein [Burkholderiales bacterium]|nr:tripartite tricarboxylate transporter substrate binding protein [Burkholderiales bacterium]